MQYGCIGEHLSHSFSKIIHGKIADYTYELKELAPGAVDAFWRARDFKAVNVTIPYKGTPQPHLYYIDPIATKIGAVNTVVNREGRLYGYNTDFYGLKSLIEHKGICLKGKKVLILGSGGTSKTALAVSRSLGAREIYRLSRKETGGCITYDTALQRHTDADIIINTTPVGMFPHIGNAAIDIAAFPRLTGVVDAVYNPLRSALVLAAEKRGIPATGGLYMLVAQAVKAAEYFLDSPLPADTLSRIYREIKREKENVVLIGMPGCGKSTVGVLLSQRTGKPLIDTDTLIVQKAGKDIPTIFAEQGEAGFRELESEVIRSLTEKNGLIIATGGGAVLREQNVNNLKANGTLFFLDRPLSALVGTPDRPLAGDPKALARRYRERYDIYCAVSDIKIKNPLSAKAAAEAIEGLL